MTSPSGVQTVPVLVQVQNWADQPAKPPTLRNTTFRTIIVDPANPNVPDRSMQICNYEPKRARLTIQVIDSPVLLLVEPPVLSPAPAVVAAGPPPQGLYLPVSTAFEGYCFYGPDAFYLNSITGSAVGRVTIRKEYYE